MNFVITLMLEIAIFLGRSNIDTGIALRLIFSLLISFFRRFGAILGFAVAVHGRLLGLRSFSFRLVLKFGFGVNLIFFWGLGLIFVVDIYNVLLGGRIFDFWLGFFFVFNFGMIVDLLV
jgi:hypothetical protein